VLHPNGMWVLEQLGLAQGTIDIGARIRYLEIMRESSVLRIPFEQVWAGAQQPTVALQRADLHSALVQRALSRHDDLRLRLGCALTGLETGERQAVAHFSDGSTAAYDLVIGADGVGSGVRQAVWPESEVEQLGLLFWRFCASNSIGLPPDVWRTVERSNFSFGFIPLGRDKIHCFVQLVLRGDKPYRPGEEESFLGSKVAASEPVLAEAISARDGAIHVGPALSVRVPSWRRGRCVLLGDAAHALSPTFSQGGSLAMEDALVLAQMLHDSPTIDIALERYEAARAPRVAWATRMATSQINAIRRNRSNRSYAQTDATVATEHLRQMYGPLLSSPLMTANARAGGSAWRGTMQAERVEALT
jgi:2-polyprenyl-6-methoxyphenol hydroxylase-like FAD-dependent oxidoreductase